MAVFNPVGGAVAAVGALALSIGLTFGNDKIDDDLARAGGTDLSISNLADSWAGFKLEMLAGIDALHNATFSNGLAGSVAGPRVSSSPRFNDVLSLTIPR